MTALTSQDLIEPAEPGNERGVARGRPRIPEAGPAEKVIAAAVLAARRQQKVSVRLLLERMDIPMSAPAYARFESGARAVPDDVLASICRALDLDPRRLAAEADGTVASLADAVVETETISLDPRGPQVPAIRIKVDRLAADDQTWLGPVLGMLRLHAAGRTDADGELLVEEPLIKTISQIVGRSLFECWVALSKFIDIEDRQPD